MFKNPFSFKGRIRRLEYGLSNLIYLAGICVAVLLTLFFQMPEGDDPPFFFYILWIPCAWFMLAQGAKRCHDRGNSGIWQIIPFYELWMFFVDGEIGDNEYGANPKHDVYEYFPDEQGKSGVSQMDDVDVTGVPKDTKSPQ